MPVTFDQLVALVRADLQGLHESAVFDPAVFDPAYVAKVGDQLLAAIVRATLKGIDHHINAAGEVYSPVPPPTTVYSGVRTPANVRMVGVHFKGQRRRKGRR